MKILVSNGRIIDPSQGIDSIGDILIEDGKIKEVIKSGASKAGRRKTGLEGETVIDAGGMLVVPGLVDMHVHLREPGFEYKETIRSGTAAAVRGGFTSVCCMPNTNPVNDNASVTEFILKKAASEGSCSVYPVGAITKGQKGLELAELAMMHDAGCVAFSDDGRPVADSLVMRRALEYAKIRNLLIISHCEDISLSAGGVMNEGLLSVTLGLKGIPPQAEEIIVARDVALAELAEGRLHVAHVSTAGSVQIIRAAKKRGLARITAETCPHYFSTTEEAVRGYNANARVNPPLRTARDVEAIKEGLADGTIDVIATDHAPHHLDEKMGEFDLAPSGISGLETAVGLGMRLVEEDCLTLSGLIEKMSWTPAKVLGIKGGTLRAGADADMTIIDTKREYKVDGTAFASRGKNTPFDGWVLKGRPVTTICGGRIYKWD